MRLFGCKIVIKFITLKAFRNSRYYKGMLAFVDNFLNKITMYRLVLYCLIFLWCMGLILSFLHLLPFTPLSLIFSSTVIFTCCVAVNTLFALLFKAPSNTESTYITAFILMLIAGPALAQSEFLMLAMVCALAIASKYLLAINKKHIFNPAGFAVAVSALGFSYYASWWVGDLYMAPWVLITGFLIVRKLQWADLVVSFMIVFIITSLGKGVFDVQHIFLSVKNLFAYSPILFFSFVMLTEPATNPSKKTSRVAYGSLVAFLQAPFIHLGGIYFSPELALMAGNIFSYMVSPKQKLVLTLRKKIKIADDTVEFVFHPPSKLHFLPGQYLEWTLSHQKQDGRGMRRYFTIASSPTESEIKLGVKFYQKPSSYKKALDGLALGDSIVASQLAGEFTMPADVTKKLVFLAGGIGVTPFRSMVRYLIDTSQKRDITIFYASKSYSDIAYEEVFDEARRKFGIKTVYVLNDTSNIPPDFTYQEGVISKEMILQQVPDFKERIFYISGPRAMIVSFKKTLKEIGIPTSQIKTDFFPGFA